MSTSEDDSRDDRPPSPLAHRPVGTAVGVLSIPQSGDATAQNVRVEVEFALLGNRSAGTMPVLTQTGILFQDDDRPEEYNKDMEVESPSLPDLGTGGDEGEVAYPGPDSDVEEVTTPPTPDDDEEMQDVVEDLDELSDFEDYDQADEDEQVHMFENKKLTSSEAKQIIKSLPRTISRQYLKGQFERLDALRDGVVSQSKELDDANRLCNYLLKKKSDGKHLCAKEQRILEGLYSTNSRGSTRPEDNIYLIACTYVQHSMDHGRVFEAPVGGWRSDTSKKSQRVSFQYLIDRSYTLEEYIATKNPNVEVLARTIGYTIAIAAQAILYRRYVTEDPSLVLTLSSLMDENPALLLGAYKTADTKCYIPSGSKARILKGDLIGYRALEGNLDTALRYYRWSRHVAHTSTYARLRCVDAAAHFTHGAWSFDEDKEKAWQADPSNPVTIKKEYDNYKKRKNGQKRTKRLQGSRYDPLHQENAIGEEPEKPKDPDVVIINDKDRPHREPPVSIKFFRRSKAQRTEASLSSTVDRHGGTPASTRQPAASSTVTQNAVTPSPGSDNEPRRVSLGDACPCVFVHDETLTHADVFLSFDFVEQMIIQKRYGSFVIDGHTYCAIFTDEDDDGNALTPDIGSIFNKGRLIREHGLGHALLGTSSLMYRRSDPRFANVLLISEDEGLDKHFNRRCLSDGIVQNFVVIHVPAADMRTLNFIQDHKKHNRVSSLFISRDHIPQSVFYVQYEGLGRFLDYDAAQELRLENLPTPEEWEDIAAGYGSDHRVPFVFAFLPKQLQDSLPTEEESFATHYTLQQQQMQDPPQVKFTVPPEFMKEHAASGMIAGCRRPLSVIRMANDPGRFHRLYFHQSLFKKDPVALSDLRNEHGISFDDLLYLEG